MSGPLKNPAGSGAVLRVLRMATRGLRTLLPKDLRTRHPEDLQGPRCGFLSHVLPPMWSGQAMVIDRLLQHLPPDYCVLITKPAYAEARNATELERHVLPPEPGEGPVLRRVCVGMMCLIQRILVRGWRVAKILRNESCDAIVAATGDLVDVPAAAVASELTQKPLVLYLFDDYLNQWGFSPKLVHWAKDLEAYAVARASRIIVPNEYMGEELQRRYERTTFLVRNPAFRIAGASTDQGSQETADANAPIILYTGAIYHANAAAFHTLLHGMRKLRNPQPQPQLHIYSAQKTPALQSLGISGTDVHLNDHVAPETAFHLQAQADVLFMGFSFNSKIPTVVQTSAPGKLGDYLGSGRPILALTPHYSYLAHFLRTHECGFVVDCDDPDLIAEALDRLLTDRDLVERLVSNALQVAHAEFAPQESARRFRVVLEDVMSPSHRHG